MRIINFALALLFILFAFLQINDPDPILWILIYGAMAAVCVMAAFEFYLRKVLIGLAVLYSLFSIYYFPGLMEWLGQEDKSALFDNVAKMEHVYIEESREFLGLMICLVVIILYLFRSKRSKMV